MKTHYRRTIVFAMLMLLTGIAPAVAEEKDASVAASKQVETTVKGERVEMMCSMPAKSAVGRPIPLRVEITNHSQDEITYYNTGRLFNVRYSVTDRHGKDVPLTKWGQMYLRSDGAVRKNSAHMLKPGDTFVLEENLARYFDLSITEKCTVTIRWHSGSEYGAEPKKLDEVETTLEFQIVEAGALEPPREEADEHAEEAADEPGVKEDEEAVDLLGPKP